VCDGTEMLCLTFLPCFMPKRIPKAQKPLVYKYFIKKEFKFQRLWYRFVRNGRLRFLLVNYLLR